jgi:hypothetical protein
LGFGELQPGHLRVLAADSLKERVDRSRCGARPTVFNGRNHHVDERANRVPASRALDTEETRVSVLLAISFWNPLLILKAPLQNGKFVAFLGGLVRQVINGERWNTDAFSRSKDTLPCAAREGSAVTRFE